MDEIEQKGRNAGDWLEAALHQPLVVEGAISVVFEAVPSEKAISVEEAFGACDGSPQSGEYDLETVRWYPYGKVHVGANGCARLVSCSDWAKHCFRLGRWESHAEIQFVTGPKAGHKAARLEEPALVVPGAIKVIREIASIKSPACRCGVRTGARNAGTPGVGCKPGEYQCSRVALCCLGSRWC